MGVLERYFKPDWTAPSIFALEPDVLRKRGIRFVIADLDNTLVPWNEKDATPTLRKWAAQLTDAGVTLMIVSNNHQQRVQRVAEPIEAPFFASALKPLGRGVRALLRQAGASKAETVLVGDQLLTDILCAKRLGLKCILVAPLVETDHIATKLNRWIEHFILNLLKQHDNELLEWGRGIER